MRINNREKIMLMLLILVVVGWLSFDLIIEEQLKAMEEMKIELSLKQKELENLRTLISRESEIDREIENSYLTIQTVAKEYFNTTRQEELVLLLTDFLLMPYISESTIGFAEPALINIGEVEFQKDSVSLSVSGQYESLVNMLKTIWKFPRKIDVSNLSVTSSGFDEVSAQLTLDFYTFFADANIVDDLYKWYIDDLFLKENPFAEVVDNGIVVRYLYLQDDELFNYTQYFEFADLEGHWLEYEIKEFLDLGYLYLNPYLEFGPDEPITRGEFIVLMDSYYQWPIVYDDQVNLTDFRDYDDLGSLESSFAKAIHKGYLSGIVEGYTDNTLRPRDYITYEEVEFLMNKIKEIDNFKWNTVAGSIKSSKGIDKPDWATKDGTLTRAEAVYLLYYYN